jgi:N-acetylglutamate synthase-like GNAT family acetyltransferase
MLNLSMNLRQAVHDDLPALAALIGAASPLKPSYLDASVSSGLCLLVEIDGRIAGCGVLSYDFFDRGFVKLLYVNEIYRCRGVGSALLLALEARCTTRVIFTSTNRSNLPMQKLLAKRGYQPSGSVEGLDPGDPELIYRKPLDCN